MSETITPCDTCGVCHAVDVSCLEAQHQPPPREPLGIWIQVAETNIVELELASAFMNIFEHTRYSELPRHAKARAAKWAFSAMAFLDETESEGQR